jgi:hypothetical protein
MFPIFRKDECRVANLPTQSEAKAKAHKEVPPPQIQIFVRGTFLY